MAKSNQAGGAQGSGCLRPNASKTIMEVPTMVVEPEGFKTPLPAVECSVNQQTAAHKLPSVLHYI